MKHSTGRDCDQFSCLCWPWSTGRACWANFESKQDRELGLISNVCPEPESDTWAHLLATCLPLLILIPKVLLETDLVWLDESSCFCCFPCLLQGSISGTVPISQEVEVSSLQIIAMRWHHGSSRQPRLGRRLALLESRNKPKRLSFSGQHWAETHRSQSSQCGKPFPRLFTMSKSIHLA
jgi:hypothetical protein